MLSEPVLLAGGRPILSAGLLAGARPPADDYDADIIILSHHRPQETIAAIRSAAGQTGCAHHVIVLDQGSPPACRAALIVAVTPLANVALYGIAENRGVPGGRNLAASLGRGRVIVALDNDATFAGPDVVARAAARLGVLPDLGAIGFRILAADGAALDQTSWGYPRGLLEAAASRFTTTMFVGCGHALSRACFAQLGGYDDSLFFTWEEYEFARRAIAVGWQIEHHGDLAVIHGVAAEARVTWEGARWHYFVRNRLLIAHDWHGRAGMLPRACVYLARGIAAGRTMVTIEAMLAAWRMAATRSRRRATSTCRRYIRAHEMIHRLPTLAIRVPRDATFDAQGHASGHAPGHAPGHAMTLAMPAPRAAHPAPSGRF